MRAAYHLPAILLAIVSACGRPAAQPDAAVQPDASQPYFLSPTTYPAPGMPSAIAVGDIDSDGKPDIVIATAEQQSAQGGVAVLLATGGGAFADTRAYAVGKLPSAITTADVDADGRVDVAISDAGANAAFISRAGADGVLGAWTSYPVGPWPLSIVSADVNADGHADLVVANNLGNGANGVMVLLGDGAGGFMVATSAAAGSFPMAVGVADFNRDGKADLAIADQGPLQGDSTAAVMFGRGDGTFAAPTMSEVGNFPDSIAVGDLNGDGRFDIVVVNEYDGTTSVLLSTGDGTFAPQQRYPVTGSSVAIADVDGDGKPEVLIGAGDLVVLHNAGDATFDTTWTVPCGCGRIAIADLNQDGKTDIAGVDVAQSGATWESRSNAVSVLLHVQ